jgi:hypothetical protein
MNMSPDGVDRPMLVVNGIVTRWDKKA